MDEKITTKYWKKKGLQNIFKTSIISPRQSTFGWKIEMNKKWEKKDFIYIYFVCGGGGGEGRKK